MSEETEEIEELKTLSDKEKIFCKEYIIDFNGARSAREAGYSEKGAKEQAYRMLTKVHIQQEIKRLLTPRLTNLEITSKRVAQECASIAYAQLREIGDWDAQGNLTVKTPDEIPESLHPAIQTIKRIENQQGIRFEIKLFNKDKALEMIAKHTKFFEEPAQVTNNTTNNNFLSTLPTDKLKRILEIVREE